MLEMLAMNYARDDEISWDSEGNAVLTVDPQDVLDREGVPYGNELEEALDIEDPGYTEEDWKQELWEQGRDAENGVFWQARMTDEEWAAANRQWYPEQTAGMTDEQVREFGDDMENAVAAQDAAQWTEVKDDAAERQFWADHDTYLAEQAGLEGPEIDQASLDGDALEC
jgi:hypothetical protein